MGLVNWVLYENTFVALDFLLFIGLMGDWIDS